MGTVILEECELMKDSKYRLYANAIDKALKSFEYSSEWADLISALGKLNKVLVSYSKYPVIPRRIKISKRLAQCMHPALPSGVHLKGLETYDIIFRNIGTNRLSQELFIYSAGLFPLLVNAATNVKQTLLTIYETHFVPLGEKLRPGLSGFLSGVLLGLEEGSDFFNRINGLLEKVCDGVSPIVFYGNLWESLVSNNAVRLPAVIFVLSHWDKSTTIENQLHIIGLNIDIMVNALCACLNDSSALVQRNALDFLLVAFPMHNTVLTNVHKQKLVMFALMTILRRDMSLNRRLYAWLLGSEICLSMLPPDCSKLRENDHDIDITEQYFETYSRLLLINAIKEILKKATSQIPHDLRPYRILISLLDKTDIGPVILDDILYEVFRLLYLCSKNLCGDNNSTNNTELLKNANLLFSSLEPRYLWHYVGVLFSDSCRNLHFDTASSCTENKDTSVKSVGSGQPSFLEVCDLISFLVDNLALDLYPETLTEYLPELFLHIVTVLTEDCDSLTAHYAATSLKLSIKILSHVRLPFLISNKDLGYSSIEHTDRDINMKNKSLEPGKVIQVRCTTSESDVSGFNSVSSSSSLINKDAISANNKLDNLSIESDNTSGIDTPSTSTMLSLETINAASDVDSITSVETLTANINMKRRNDNYKTGAVSETILDRCLKQYENFFVTFMYGVRVKIGEIKNIDNLFQMLKIKSPNTDTEDRAKHLEELLQAVLYNSNRVPTRLLEYNYVFSYRDRNDEDVNNDSETANNVSSPIKILNYKRSIGIEWTDAVSFASKLLLELSTFQTTTIGGSPFNSPFGSVNNIAGNADDDVVPVWLKALIVFSCWLGNVAVELQLVTISTLLDLSMLCKRASSRTSLSTTEGVTSVLVIPLMKPIHLNYIEQNTNVFQVIAHWLWHHLGNPMFNVKSAELLHQLQSLLYLTDIVENCIGESLSCKTLSENERLHSFRKFIILWHIGREITSKSSNSIKLEDIFYKSMLKMLDNLQLEESNCLKSETEIWLFHIFLTGDSRRLFEPLFTVLLDESTARISILHAKVQKIDSEAILSNEKYDNPILFDKNCKFYVIASADNNAVIHHLSRKLLSDQNEVIFNGPIDDYLSKLSVYGDFDDYGNDEDAVINGSISSNATIKTKSLKIGADQHLAVKKSKRGVTSNDSNRLSASSLHILKNSSFSSLENLKFTSHIPVHLASSSMDIFNLPLSFKIPTKWNKLIGDKNNCTSSERLSVTKENADNLIANEVDGELITRSYSFSGKNVTKSEFESPQDAANATKFSTSQAISSSIVSEIIDYVMEKLEQSELRKNSDGVCNEPAASDIVISSTGNKEASNAAATAPEARTAIRTEINRLHSHMLIYLDVYDSMRIYYILQTVRNVLLTSSRAFIISASSTYAPPQSYLFQLFLRHRRSILAQGFSNNIEPSSFLNRNVTFLEILIYICLYYVRSYYPNFLHVQLTEKDLAGNRQVQIICVDLLSQLCTHLCSVIRECDSAYACYLLDLFCRCKLQKIVLYSLHSTLNTTAGSKSDNISLTEDVLNFNSERNAAFTDITKYSEALQIHLLRLLLSLILIENEIQVHKKEPETMPLSIECSDLEYVKNLRIPHQPIFYAILMKALESSNPRMRHLHQYYTSVVVCSLPYLKQALVEIISIVVQRLCDNIESAAEAFEKSDNSSVKLYFPSDYIVTQTGTLTVMCHYCLLNSNQSFNTSFSSSSSVPSRVITSIMHILNPSPVSTDTKEDAEILQNAKKAILNILPRIVSKLSVLWQALILSRQKNKGADNNHMVGNIELLRNQVIQYLTPIATNHSLHFFASIAVVWNERKSNSQNVKAQLCTAETANESQQILLHLISSMKSISVEMVVNTVHQVLKQPAVFEPETSTQIELSILEFFIQYANSITALQLSENWNCLLPLLREAPTVSTSAQFLLFAVLNQFVLRTSGLRLERRDQKEVQDMIIKLVELCSQTAGACLEQTTWLRRNLAVRDGEPPTATSGMLAVKDGDKYAAAAQHSLTAQNILAQCLPRLLDVGFGQLEKERVVIILTNVMYNVTPYLKNHTQKNAASFYSCSELLAKLSTYPYTRKAWKKDAMDLLLDPNFFQMEAKSLSLWQNIIDNLMSQDNSTFRDLLTRISTSQGNSLNLFSSRDSEYDQKAQFLKRLAFVILCSEQDQFYKHMPDIQEKLVESLRLPQFVCNLQVQVFLCFRVLLLRMAPDHVTSLWPIIVTEMVQVLLHIENDLSSDTEDLSTTSNGLQNNTQSHSLQLQLAAVKLLKLAIQLPVDRLPQFQMYRWAFLGSAKYQPNGPTNNNTFASDIDFVPHVTRITKLMDIKFGGPVDSLPAVLLPSGCGIRALQDLHPFFSALNRELPEIVNVRAVLELEHEIELDFIESMPLAAR